MEGLSVDIERLVRQHHIVKNALKPSIGKSTQRFTIFQTSVCNQLLKKQN
jgi:two-component system sensor histidine kinase GlrK